MALENLFIRKKRSIEGSGITVQLDTVIREKHRHRVTATQNPVEFGADITDHAFDEPKEYTMDAVVTDTPFGVAALGEVVDNVTQLFGDSSGQGVTRSQAAFNDLVRLMSLHEPITLQTGLRLYDNMLITGLAVDQDKSTSKAIFFTMDVQEIIIVQSRIVERPEDTLRGDTRMGGASVTSRGRQLPQPISESTSQSILAKIIDAAGSQ